MVLAEAMAAGCPVLALDGPGVRDVVADRHNGRLLASDADPGAFADAMANALEESGERTRWARAARRTARRFDRKRCARAVLDLYDSLERNAHSETPDWDWWDRIQARLEAEWTLVSSKAGSLGRGIGRRSGGRPGNGSTNWNDSRNDS